MNFRRLIKNRGRIRSRKEWKTKDLSIISIARRNRSM